MSLEAVSILEKADNRTAIKSLEKVDSSAGSGESSVLESTLINILFNTYSKEQLLQISIR